MKMVFSLLCVEVCGRLWEDVIYRYNYFERLIIDGGPENKKHINEFIKKYNIKRVITSIYYPQTNGMIERGHIITNKLAKIKDDWVKNLSTILWTDQSIVIRR